jgi:hypothetical protein
MGMPRATEESTPRVFFDVRNLMKVREGAAWLLHDVAHRTDSCGNQRAFGHAKSTAEGWSVSMNEGRISGFRP